MNVQDLSHNRRIARLSRLTRELEQSHAPEQTLRTVQRGFADVDGFTASMLLSTRRLHYGQYRLLQIDLDEHPYGDLFDLPSHEPSQIRSGGIIAQIIARAEPQLIQNVDWSRDPFFDHVLNGFDSVIALPIASSRLPMDWAILLKKPPQRFTEADLEEAVKRAALVGALLENQSLAGELARANEQIDREARELGQLQRALLPAQLPPAAGFELAASYEPSSRAGGDLYDFFPLDELLDHSAQANGTARRWCVFIGDTAGHGLPAAIVMAIVQAVLHAHPARVGGPAALLMHANRQLCSRRIDGFVTAFLGIYEPATGRLSYARAGHPPPLLRRASEKSIAALDEVGSYPLGIDDAETFEEATVALQRGDTLLLYTDGIIEARARASSDLFGRDRVTQLLRRGAETPAELIEYLRAAVREHEHGQAARDDQTLVAARVL